MANILRETDPIVQPGHGQYSPQSNAELKDAACQLMQAVMTSDSPSSDDSPELPRKPTLLELAQRSRARNENLSLQQLVNLTIAKDRWRSIAVQKSPPEVPRLHTCTPDLKEPPSLAKDDVCPVMTSSTSSGIDDDAAAATDDDDETNLLSGNGVDAVNDDSREYESDDGSWQTCDPRAKLISSV